VTSTGAPVMNPPASTPLATSGAAQSRTGSSGPRVDLVGQGAHGVDFELSRRVTRAATCRSYERKPADPLFRPLRIFTLDPSAACAAGAIATVNVPYEPLDVTLEGTMFKIVDDGLAPNAQLDLNDLKVLIDQGLRPSTTDPRFRAQMAYAVCATTYAAFRQALGRQPSWCFQRGAHDQRATPLVVRTSVEGTRNAYYDSQRGELSFGSFVADKRVTGRNMPGGRIHTVLQHDVVVHETAHALLDGMRAHFLAPTNPDVLAFHEAFADLIAVFQRFTYRDVVRAALQSARGEVTRATALVEVGKQFGDTTGMMRALRNAIHPPSTEHAHSVEPHERGQLLLAAVFDAFATAYTVRSSRLIRLATGGSGLLPPGALPDLLLDHLTELACKMAAQFLSICIRAIDYCPPVDLTFGEFLRAVITADFDLVRDDIWGYREAWVDAFREREIYPQDVPSLSEDALLWRAPQQGVPEIAALAFARLQFRGDPAHPASAEELTRQALELGALVSDPRYLDEFGVARNGDERLQGDKVELPTVESIRSARRVGPSGQLVFDLVAEVTQRRHIAGKAGEPGFCFYGGSTIILDPLGAVRYVIRKSVLQNDRLQATREALPQLSKFWTLGPERRLVPNAQPFRLVHEHKRRQ